jgi:hypothetical protein
MVRGLVAGGWIVLVIVIFYELLAARSSRI